MKTRCNGHEVEYALSGPKDAPVAVFSHSLASSSVMWEPQAAFFERTHRVLRYDTRGHGGSEATPGPYSFELLAEDLSSLLEQLGIRRVHFAGLSMGGMIGQALALARPELLSTLTLSDTSAFTSPEAAGAWETRIEAVRRNGLAPQLEAAMDRWFSPSFRAEGSALYDKIRRRFLATSAEGYAGCAAAIKNLNFLERLREIRVPTLVVVGEEDPGTPLSAARSIHERINGSRLAVIPAARHLPNVERPREFNDILADFLRSP